MSVPFFANRDIIQRLDYLKQLIGVPVAVGVVQDWWESLEELNKDQMHLVLKLAGELERRGVTISDFFDVWRNSHLEDVEANLALLDTLIQDKDFSQLELSNNDYWDASH